MLSQRKTDDKGSGIIILKHKNVVGKALGMNIDRHNVYFKTAGSAIRARYGQAVIFIYLGNAASQRAL